MNRNKTKMPQTGRARGRPGDRLDPAPAPVLDPQNGFKFPKMPLAEIQEDMQLFSHPISKETIRDPSPKDFKDICDFFVEEIYERRPESFAQPAFGCLEEVEFAELYEESVLNLHGLRQSQEMFHDAKFSNVGLRDVHAPEKTRFHWQLSALINFLKFRSTRLALFEEITANADDLAEKENANIEERTALEQEISKIEEVRAQEEPEVEALEELISNAKVTQQSLHNQQQEINERSRATKQHVLKASENHTALTVKRTALAGEVDRLKSRIVSSPDRLKGSMDDMSNTIATQTESIGDYEKRTRMLKMRVAAQEKCAQDVEKAIAALEGLSLEKDRVKELREADRKATEALKERENEISECETQKKHLERALASVQQRVQRMREQSNAEDAAQSEEDRAWIGKETAAAQKEVECSRLAEQKKEEIMKIQERMLAEVTAFSEELTNFSKQKDKVREKFAAYRSDLQQARELISADNNESFQRFKTLVE